MTETTWRVSVNDPDIVYTVYAHICTTVFLRYPQSGDEGG